MATKVIAAKDHSKQLSAKEKIMAGLLRAATEEKNAMRGKLAELYGQQARVVHKLRAILRLMDPDEEFVFLATSNPEDLVDSIVLGVGDLVFHRESSVREIDFLQKAINGQVRIVKSGRRGQGHLAARIKWLEGANEQLRIEKELLEEELRRARKR